MIEKGKHAYDKGRMVGTIFIDLSKAFGTLDHNFLLAKLNSYGFSFNVIKFIQSYLWERFHWTISLNDCPRDIETLGWFPVGQSYVMGTSSLFSLGWPPFCWWCHNKNALWGRCFSCLCSRPLRKCRLWGFSFDKVGNSMKRTLAWTVFWVISKNL